MTVDANLHSSINNSEGILSNQTQGSFCSRKICSQLKSVGRAVAKVAAIASPEVATVALIIGIVSIFNPLLTPVAIGLGIAAGSLLAVVLVAGIIAAIGAGCVASSSAA